MVFIPTYLYIKQHTITGKLYFDKTIYNPEKYLGSDKNWKSHIKKHGKEPVVNLWYYLFKDQEEYTSETKLKMSEIAKSQPKVCCPHCGKIRVKSLMTRYHFDKCKLVP